MCVCAWWCRTTAIPSLVWHTQTTPLTMAINRPSPSAAQQFISIKISFTCTSIIIFHLTIRDFGGDANNEATAHNNTVPHIFGERLQEHVPDHGGWMAKHKARSSRWQENCEREKKRKRRKNKLNRIDSRWSALFVVRAKSWPSCRVRQRFSITMPHWKMYLCSKNKRRKWKGRRVMWF